MKALFPGSFDPFTVGHADIAERTLKFADEIVIAIGTHPNKQGMLSPKERKERIECIFKNDPRVKVEIYQGLTTDFASECGADVMVRGVRSVADFEYERNIAELNLQLTGIETILLFANPQYSAISSSAVRELMSYGKDVSKLTEYTHKTGA